MVNEFIQDQLHVLLLNHKILRVIEEENIDRNQLKKKDFGGVHGHLRDYLNSYPKFLKKYNPKEHQH